MKSFQDDFPQVDNLCENDAVKLTDFDQDESASELMNDYKLMDDELLAGIPEIKCDCLKESKSKKINSYLRMVIKLIEQKPDLIRDKSIILTIVLEIVTPIIHYKKLESLYNIDSIVLIYAEKLADTILSGKYLTGEEYTLDNIIDLTRKFTYLRAISWKKQLIIQHKHSLLWSSDFIYDRDENGDLSDVGYSDKQGLNSIRNLTNEYRYSPEDIGLFNAIIEKALKKMASKHSKNARLHFEIMASDLNRTDLIKKRSILHKVDENELSQRRFQARKSFYLIALGYYPGKKEQQILGRVEHKKTHASPENIGNIDPNISGLEVKTLHNDYENDYDDAA